MAFVNVTWTYGDTSTIKGFRIYRDGKLRYETENKALRTYDDSVDDTTELKATYAVVAFDIYGRESSRCSQPEVNLTYIMTPTMTSQFLPSGNAYSTYTGAIQGVTTGYLLFNKAIVGSTGERIDGNGSGTGAWEMQVYYIFTEPKVIDRIGYLADVYEIDVRGSEFPNRYLKVYGKNDGDLNWSYITDLDVLTFYTDGTEITETLRNPVRYNQFKFTYGGSAKPNNVYFKQIGDLLLYGKPQ